MTDHYDVAIAGLGTMGAATCCMLAQRGARVIGFDRFNIPHTFGSHGGHSRAFRLAYYEHPDYVPLLLRAEQLWQELNRALGTEMFLTTGGVYLGRADAELLAGSLHAAARFNLPCEALTHDQVRARYPQFNLPDDFIGVHEPRAGVLLPERIVAGYAQLALEHNATLHGREPIIDWHQGERHIRIETDRRTCTADQLIICCGAWAATMLQAYNIPLNVTRQTLAWFALRNIEQFARDIFPIWGWHGPDGVFRYGFPLLPGCPGVKIAHHHPGPIIDIDSMQREATADDERELRASFQHVFHCASGATSVPQRDEPTTIALQTCVYTNSPDGHFIIDRLPGRDRVLIATGFSGHGFKFAPVIGEALADLATAGRTDLPIEFLAMNRFVSQATAR